MDATGRLGVRVEVWPVAADGLGIWLLTDDGDAWRSPLIAADSEPHLAVRTLLREHDSLDRARVLHSTSWRPETDGVVLTYVTVLGCFGYVEDVPAGRRYTFVRDEWPAARPVTLTLAETVGKPPPHAAIEPPHPRYVDVLMHGIRHLAFLLQTDSTVSAALDGHWRAHLVRLEPTLSGMYRVSI